MSEEREQEFLRGVRRTLHEAEQGLDAHTLTQLRRARQRALAAHSTGRWWQRRAPWLATAALAAGLTVVALAGMMWLRTPPPGLPSSGVEDLELLAAQDGLDFYADLEFYYWLTTSSDAG